MPVQTYNINIQGAQAGDLYGLTYTNSLRESFRTAVECAAGKVVKRGASDREVTLGSAGAGMQFGVVIRQMVVESDFRPNTGAALFPIGSIVPVLLEGTIQLVTIGGATAGGAVYVNDLTGDITNVPTTEFVLADNMKFDSSGAAGDIVRVFISRSLIVLPV